MARRGVRCACLIGVCTGCADLSEGSGAASGTDGSTGASTGGSRTGGTGTSAASMTASASGSSTTAASGATETTTAGPDVPPSGTGPDVPPSCSTGDPAAPAPLVFAHGFFGFDDFAGAGFVDYFWDVRGELMDTGETQVFMTEVDPFNSSTVRGEQLLARVEAILEETGATRVNLIGHSQGGLDARVVASLRPDLVQSVTTIAAPHGGTPIADFIVGLAPPGSGSELIAGALLQFFGAPLWGALGPDSSVLASMQQFSQAGIAEFDATYPDAPGMPYYSIAGRSDWHPGGPDCAVANLPAFMQPYAEDVDPIDPLFALAEAAIDGPPFNPIPNDGLVRVRDAKRGEFWGCIPADHVDQIGHLFGDNPGFGNSFDHLAFHVGLAAHLRSLGH